MIVKHSCGHEVNVPSRNAPFIKKTFCWECEQLARRLQREQNQKFTEVKDLTMTNDVIYDSNEYEELMREGYQEMSSLNLWLAEEDMSIALETWPEWETSNDN